jgi:hypothetical protein
MMRPGQTGGKKQRVAEHLKERLNQGDAAMVMLAASGRSRFGQNNPMTSMLDGWGIQPQLDRVIMRMRHRSSGPDQAVRQHQVDNWPDELKITRALGSMQGMFVQSSPIKLSDEKTVTHYPLVRLQGDRLWAETDMQAASNPSNAEYDENNAADNFRVGVAAKKQNGPRLIAVADRAWANDLLTSMGMLGRGTASITGARFPANSELFVNSVYWLAGMEGLIAASPRTQDVPRIDPNMTTAALYSYRTFVVGGLPVLAMGLGIGVWFVRRRG